MQAFVDFDSGAEAERAITTKDRQVFAQKFGDRYVRLVQACPVSKSCIAHAPHSLITPEVSVTDLISSHHMGCCNQPDYVQTCLFGNEPLWCLPLPKIVCLVAAVIVIL